jgi:hypothetical protein
MIAAAKRQYEGRRSEDIIAVEGMNERQGTSAMNGWRMVGRGLVIAAGIEVVRLGAAL